MRHRIDVAEIYRDALDTMPGFIDGRAPLPVPTNCPFTLDELFDESHDLRPTQPPQGGAT